MCFSFVVGNHRKDIFGRGLSYFREIVNIFYNVDNYFIFITKPLNCEINCRIMSLKLRLKGDGAHEKVDCGDGDAGHAGLHDAAFRGLH